MEIDLGEEVVVKRGTTTAETERVAAEAAFLRAVAHPGLVEPVPGVGEDELRTARVRGGPLSGLGPTPAEFTAGWGAALASTLADLHDIGRSHGGICEDHILFDDAGRPVLCSLGRSARAVDGAAGDVSDLARLLAERLGPMPAGARGRTLAKALKRASGGGLDARALARALVTAYPDARIRPVGEAATAAGGLSRPGTERHRWPLAAAAAVVAAIAAVAGAARLGGATHRPAQAPGSYQVSGAGGTAWLVAVGRWDCANTQAAALDPATGAIWLFDGWPSPQPVVGRFVEDVRGAVGLGALSVGRGCDRIAVLRSGGPALILTTR